MDDTAARSQTFACRRCGICCTWHQPFVTEADTARIIEYLGITEREWLERYDDPRWQGSQWRLIRQVNGACAFLEWENGLAVCKIHAVKPACCAAWQPGADKKECKAGRVKPP